MTSPVSRTAILAWLREHPRCTANDIAIGLGAGRRASASVNNRLHAAERAGLVIAVPSPDRRYRGRPVRLWLLAPEGTPAPGLSLLSADQLARRRQRDKHAKRRERARKAGRVLQGEGDVIGVPADLPVAVPWDLAPLAACADMGPELFFPLPGEDDGPAKAVCAVCPIASDCLARARANGESWGVWGGVNLADLPQDVAS